MRRIGVVLGCLALLGCPGDGSGDTDTDSGTGTDTDGMTMTATTPSTSMSGTTSSSTTDMPTTDTPTTDTPTTDTPTTDNPTTDGPTSGTTTGGGECDACIEKSCAEEGAACIANPACVCWVDCIEAGSTNEECILECEGPPDELGDLFDCIDQECGEECSDGGTGTTGGGGGDSYDPCGMGMECNGDLECNMFINYCSVDCTREACPAPPSGNASPICSNISDNCILPCDDATMCPDGMTCQDVGGSVDLCIVDGA